MSKFIDVCIIFIIITTGTIFKQLQRIYNNGFPVEERVIKKNIIYENVLRNMMSLIKATHTFQIPIEKEDNRER